MSLIDNRTTERGTNAPPSNGIMGKKHYVGKATMIEPVFLTHARFFDCIRDAIGKTSVFDNRKGRTLPLESALSSLRAESRRVHKAGGRVIFVGNGGSAAIASHCAIDWTKNGGIRSIAFNDAAALTCWANDAGYESVFAKQIEHHATKRDAVIVISTSGKSPNVIAAANAARVLGVQFIATFTGMNPNNLLRATGDVNYWVPANDYGLTEVAHMALLHSIVSAA